jgi:hypothetical protein
MSRQDLPDIGSPLSDSSDGVVALRWPRSDAVSRVLQVMGEYHTEYSLWTIEDGHLGDNAEDLGHELGLSCDLLEALRIWQRDWEASYASPEARLRHHDRGLALVRRMQAELPDDVEVVLL